MRLSYDKPKNHIPRLLQSFGFWRTFGGLKSSLSLSSRCNLKGDREGSLENLQNLCRLHSDNMVDSEKTCCAWFILTLENKVFKVIFFQNVCPVACYLRALLCDLLSVVMCWKAADTYTSSNIFCPFDFIYTMTSVNKPDFL